MTALALFAAFITTYNVSHVDKIYGINVIDARVMATLFIGAMLPFVFSALSMNAVGRAANDMIEEVASAIPHNPGVDGSLGADAQV